MLAMEFIQIVVTPREELGSANSRRMRGTGQVPAVLYGMKRPNMSLTIPESDLRRFLDSGSHLIELRMGDKTRPAILREVQVAELTDTILHVDFHRVDENDEVEDGVKVVYKGRAKGESEGGVFQSLQTHIQVRARPRLLPEEYLIDISGMTVGDAITVADLPVEDGVTILDAQTTLIAHVNLPKQVALSEEEEEAQAQALAAAEAAEAPAAE
jgi:large subunit ribosomal protein L25